MNIMSFLPSFIILRFKKNKCLNSQIALFKTCFPNTKEPFMIAYTNWQTSFKCTNFSFLIYRLRYASNLLQQSQ